LDYQAQLREDSMKIAILCISIAAISTGCAYQSIESYERPNGMSISPPRYQSKITSASHWKLLAKNEVKQLKQRIANKPVIVQQDNSSVFSETYFNLLTSSLVSSGTPVLTYQNEESVNVSYKVNVVTTDWGKPPPEVNTASGILVNYLLASSSEILKAPIFIVKDQFVKNLSTPTEVVITTQATSREGQLLYSASNIYYIESSNQGEYIDNLSYTYKAGDVKSISVVGSR
jgi:hypothetical protein